MRDRQNSFLFKYLHYIKCDEFKFWMDGSSFFLWANATQRVWGVAQVIACGGRCFFPINVNTSSEKLFLFFFHCMCVLFIGFPHHILWCPCVFCMYNVRQKWKNVTMIILEFALRVCLYYHSRYCQMARGLKRVFAQWVQDGQNIFD